MTSLFRLRERDTQRSRVYACDKIIRPFSREPLDTVEQMEAYVSEVWSNYWLAKHYPAMHARMYDGPPKVHDGRGRSRRAGGNYRGVWMPRWARYETLLLHELAHTITQRVYGTHVAAHGWQYCSVYLTLMLHMRGREAHDALKAAFKLHRVRYTAPRKAAPLSPEQKAERTARLAAYRASR